MIAALCLVLLSGLAQAADTRMAIDLNEEQKGFVLGHMRDMLEALTDAQQLLLAGDRDELQSRITRLQSHEQASRPKGMGQQIPPAFRAMAQSMRPHWQAIKNPATPESEVRQHMVDLMRVCNACHRTFAVQ
ncbi:hypothetical protein GCM10011338_13220 [Alteromonas lipolytica]|uniref:Cytochrome C n=2 Tax=Alteromonas lipolytica TaxID=1856405 RepID=A0A1E8FB31_9ALTE|nr:hypothetical protein BFC17_02420 [Alteromonas lipolytica]GGF62178.1 hypothetical protein GCM10011338_13220 [Alteromonas lipolytica]